MGTSAGVTFDFYSNVYCFSFKDKDDATFGSCSFDAIVSSGHMAQRLAGEEYDLDVSDDSVRQAVATAMRANMKPAS